MFKYWTVLLIHGQILNFFVKEYLNIDFFIRLINFFGKSIRNTIKKNKKQSKFRKSGQNGSPTPLGRPGPQESKKSIWVPSDLQNSAGLWPKGVSDLLLAGLLLYQSALPSPSRRAGAAFTRWTPRPLGPGDSDLIQAWTGILVGQ